jgi:hypothetical protein
MKVKIYVNTDEDAVGVQFPRVLTEKQYQEKINELVAERLDKNNLRYDDGFMDHISCDYNIAQIFLMTEEEKEKVLDEFKPYVIDSAQDEMRDYYEEFEIEI